MSKIMEKIKNLFFEQDNNESKKNGSKLMKNIIILGMIGTLFLLFGNLFSSNNSPPLEQKTPLVEASKVINSPDYAERLSHDLEEILSLIQGVGKVKVKIYITTGSTYEYEYNQNQNNKITSEIDKNGGKRQIEEDDREKNMIIIKDAHGNEKPVMKKEVKPVITGVLIVAQGAEVSKIKYDIVRAVSNFLDLPVYKISVLPYQRR